ncbi:ArsA family ATPase [Thermosphaera chiliense]|uniref:ArsA family ATPase n=1 Tax=Thermosphaera chiliense TaxID=3402707 RepID=A0A7M1UUI5_9CREN|nr:TRC40/GET3/ArsA family transport-energizing ATPase [Thermosphaera aggregans]QOR94684.1 ArsA family ATPase [Thermosphaera aggregans]
MLQDLIKPYSCCPHVVVVIGKGGVGKTTVSLLLGAALARLGRTLVLSLDPAKHLAKYIGEEVVDREHVLGENLAVRQLDVEKEVARQADQYSSMLKYLLPSLTVLNVDSVVDVVKYMPGVEEEVFLRVLDSVYSSRDYSFIVVDTPPTGVTLRTLYLPLLYMVWLDKLIKVRERIVSLRYVIARTTGREAEARDKALSILLEMKQRYSNLMDVLKNPARTSYVVVATPEPLPVYEMEETVSFLEKRLGAPAKALVLNKILPAEMARRMGVEQQQKAFIEKLSSIKKPLVLINYLGKPTESFEDVKKLESLVEVVG